MEEEGEDKLRSGESFGLKLHTSYLVRNTVSSPLL